MLLLNGSNLKGAPIFPYAFVQVREVADRYGIRVMPLELSLAREWRQLLDRALSTGPAAIGITIRQLDTLVASTYRDGDLDYRPLELTAEVIAFVRERTNAPILLGGIGYTAFAEQLFRELKPDFGVRGEPEPVFASWQNLLARQGLADIPNLVFEDGGSIRVNKRQFFPPSDRCEYDDNVMLDLERFYGSTVLHSDSMPAVPVELARGCPYSCRFCIEPIAKGHSYQVRSFEIVERDVDFLASRGISNFWLVCSEANASRHQNLLVSSAQMFMRLADRYRRPFLWATYFLPKDLTRDTLQFLRESGFRGMPNDFAPFDRHTMRAARVPYTLDQATTFLSRLNELQEANDPTRQRVVGFFLGDEHSTLIGLQRMLEHLEANGWIEYYDDLVFIEATRYYPALHGVRSPLPRLTFPARRYDASAQLETETVEPPNERNVLEPAYFYAPALLEATGGPTAVREMLSFVAHTLISRRNKNLFDPAWFLRRRLPARLWQQCAAAHTLETLARYVELSANHRLLSRDVIDRGVGVCRAVAADPRQLMRLIDAPMTAPMAQRQSNALASGAVLSWLFANAATDCASGDYNLGFSELTPETVFRVSSYAIHRHLIRTYSDPDELSRITRAKGEVTTVPELFQRFVVAFNSIQPALARPLFLAK